VKETPDKLAVVSDGGRMLTYAQLNRSCDILADWLRSKVGVKADVGVGIYLERSVEYVISYVAILKAGGAYIPLDPSHPISLLQDINSDSKPACVITNDAMETKIHGVFDCVVILNDNWQQRLISEIRSDISKRPKSSLDDLACYVYSSGTTGKPKGIMLPHRSCVYSYTLRHLVLPYDENDRVACNVFFTWEMFRPLMKGATLYVIPDNVIYDPLLLVSFLNRHSITRILFTPSLLEAVLESGEVKPESLKSLKYVWLCGEVVTCSLLERCLTMLPWIQIYNLYSISETHDVAIAKLNDFWKMQSEESKENRRKFAPVGSIAPGVVISILDEFGNEQPVGKSGEIFVGGPTLARGYLNLPDVNKKRFTEIKMGGKMMRSYRTGDWGLIKSDRSLEICGRCDSMVKIRGYSIEIQAVEAALMDLKLVNTCVVLAVGEEGQDKQLVAYVVPTHEDLNKKKLREQLQAKLPFYMIPSYFFFLKSIPVMAATGKLDKKALPSINDRHNLSSMLIDSSTDDSSPKTATEKFLARVWKDILQMEIMDCNESFFDLGGHSLLAARLLGKLREHYSVQVTMQDLFRYPTLRKLADWLDNDGKGQENDGRRQLDLKAEVSVHGAGKVNIDMQLRAFWRSQDHDASRLKRGRVLLTGVTGFLGAYLLRDLLMQTEVDVYCLVRRHPTKSAKDRILENLTFYEIIDKNCEDSEIIKQFDKRAHPIIGDVALLEMGLPQEDYIYLSYEIDYIIHAAAYVNLVYPYEALKGPNVTGTQNVLMFARTGKIKPLHYVSSNAVFANNLTACEEKPLEYDEQLLKENGYSQSKWVAEQILRKGVSQGLPITIYRMGNISGDRKKAGWNPSDFILLVLRASMLTSSWPDVGWMIEMTPVDFVSSSVVKLSQKFSSVQQIYHVVQPKPTTGRALFKWLTQDMGHKLKLVSFDQWCKDIENLKDETAPPKGHLPIKKALSSIIMSKDPYLFSYNTTFDISNFSEVLSTIGSSYPKVNFQLWRTYINELQRRNVLTTPHKSESRLSGKVAIVTGASSGIGRSIATHLAREGVQVCLVARSVDKLKELQNEITSEGSICCIFKCDVVNLDEVKKMVDFCENTLGSIDILVNNAGVMLYTRMSSALIDSWNQMIDVNCKGLINCIGSVLPKMVEKKEGHIVNMSSDAGRRGFPGLAAYSGTKFFVEGLSQAMRLEVCGQGVKVTCIQPGDVKTNISNNPVDAEAHKEFAADSNAIILDPDDVANAVVFACSQPDHVSVNEILVEPKEYPI